MDFAAKPRMHPVPHETCVQHGGDYVAYSLAHQECFLDTLIQQSCFITCNAYLSGAKLER